MAQPPVANRYGLITDSQDDYRLSQEFIDERRLATERSNQQKEAERRRQEALDQHLSKYADDPISRAVATIEFEKTEADEQQKSQTAARQKAHDKIIAKYDDPIAQAWAIMQHDDEQTKNLPAKQAFADREALQKLNEREDTTRKLDRLGKKFGLGIGDAFVRETVGSAVNVVPDLAAPVARTMEATGLAEPGTADELHRQSGDFQEARQGARRDDMSPWLSRMYGGTSQSLMQMAATPGGATSKIVGSGVMAGSQALTTAEDAGLEGTDRLRYAGSQALFEAGIAAIGQKIFGGGVESRLAGQAVAAQTYKQLAKNIGTDALKEMPEEVLTTILQDVSSKLEGISPDMQFGDFVNNATEAAVQAAMMSGMANAPNAATLPFKRNKPEPVVNDQQSAEDPNSFTQTPIDEMIAARDAAAGSQPPVPPEIDAFTKNPSRKKYNEAVKAGMPPLETSNETTRKKYADDWMKDPLGMRKKMFPSTPTQDPATLEPSMESPPAMVAGDEQQQPLMEEPNGQESDVQGIQGQREDGNQSDGTQGTQGEEGRQELLKPPAGTQDVAQPAAVNDSSTPAVPTNREEFETVYSDRSNKLKALADNDPKRRQYIMELADLFDANPDWAHEIENSTTPPVVAPGDVSPDQPSSPMADPVSTNEPPSGQSQTAATPTEVPRPSTKEEHSQLPVFSVYQTQFNGKPKFAVKQNEKGGFGDALFDTESDANQYASVVKQQSDDAMERREKAQADEEAATKKQQEHEVSFHGFLTDDPKTKGRRLKTLDSALNYKNKPTTRKALVEQKVSDGWTVNDQDQLQAPTGEFLDSRDLTKTGIDYARHVIEQKKAPAPVEPSASSTPVPAFAALPQKSQDLFNKAFESKDVEQLKQMVDKSNVAWNSEFTNRTGIKLPKTLKGRIEAVSTWAKGTEPSPISATASVIESPDLKVERQRTEDADTRKQAIKDGGFEVGDRVTQESTGRKGVLESISDTSGTVAVRFDSDGSVLSGTDVSGFVRETQENKPKVEPLSQSQSEPSQEDLMEAILREELGETEAKPAKERKPRTPKIGTAEPKAPKTPRSDAAKKRTERTAAELKAAEDDIFKAFNATPNTGLNPEQMRATARLVKAALNHNVSTFNEFVAYVVDKFKEPMALRMAEGIELAWRALKRLPEYSGIDDAGKVADVIAQKTETSDESGNTGNDDTAGREEDSAASPEDSGDTQNADSPADAEVLGDEPAANDGKTKKPRSSSSVRRGSRRKLRSGDGQADTGTGDESERSGDDGGGTSSNDPGTGRDSAPQSTRPNYHLTNPEAIIGGGPKAKFERNRKAIEIVRTLEEENRTPTAEELDTLAGYMGWGAFGQELFKGSWTNQQPKEGWEEQDEWLRIYLGEAEWKSAQDSIVNAHFTDPQTVTAVWGMLRRLGFKGGRVLEPSIGVGNFFSLMPRDLMERSALTGIELDKITAKIAKLLHPNANIQQKGYQESQTPDNFYDVIVSNVPFGAYSIPDRRYKQDFSIHNYFFKKAFDQLKPGGVIAFLTSNMTMDGKVQAKLMRAQIANQGDLVTAIRLPSGAFQAYAGTKVVADLIVIRKRKPGEAPSGQKWIQINELQTDGNEDHALDVNEYWLNNPDKILGTMTWGHGTTTGRPGMVVNQPSDLQSSLEAAIASVPENIINTERGKSEGRERANTTARRQNSILSEGGDLWQVKGEHLVPLLDAVAWYRKGSKQTTIDKNRKEIETILNVREAVRDVLDKQAASENADAARSELNKTYDAFVKEFGPIGKSAAGKHLRKAGDPMGHALLSLESVSGLVFKKYTKRPIFTRATVRQKRNIDSPTLNDAFALERNRSLDLDIDRIAVAAKMPVDAVVKKLVSEGRIYKTGNGTYDAADVFLSGNMARKLRQLEASQAEGMDGLDESIESVRERIPTPVPYSQIEAKLGATWITSEDYANYVGALVNEPGEQITVERRIQGWKVTIPTAINGKAEATTLHGHPGIDFNKLVAAAMNNATVRVTMPDPDDRSKRITDPVGTEEANAKLSELRDNFSTWLWSDSDRIARLSSVYNEEFNSTVTPDFDDVPLDFEGMAIERGDNPFNLRQHQASAVWRGIVSGKGIFAHEVGTGKTLTMAALAMENRRLGLASKPILLAHNANSLAVRNEIQEAYPGANILYVDNMDSANKDTMLQSIATEDWDLIVVPHSMAEKFMLRPETVEALLKPEMDALEAAALEAFEESQASEYAKGSMPENLDEISDEDMQALREPTAKELVKERMKLRAQIVKAQQAMGEGKGIFFEDMGIDMVMVDEAHLFKKLPITSKQRIKGLNKSASQMGNMMMMMTDYIRMNNKGRGVYLFTGTPITNTVNEVFNMMRFVMAEEMESSGVRSWDGWFNNFATQDTMTELSSGGTWENFDRIASFVNLPELRQMVGQYMDIVFADDMEEFKPRESRDGRTENPIGRPFKQVHNVIIDMLDAQRSLSEQLAARYITFRDAEGKDKVRMMREPGGQFNPLVIEGEGVKLAMDPRLTGHGTKLVDDKMVTDDAVLDPRDPNLKINKMIRNGMQHYNEHPKSAQMIFMQVGYTDSVERVVGRGDDGKAIKQRFRVFNLAKEIKRRLMEEGVAENEIAIFSGMSKEKRAEAALMMRRGEIRFAIGSTETMGTGVNAQDELVAMHHLDAPWMPGDLEQRNGRGHRQGNQWNTVHEYRYLTEGPQDGRRWQVLLTKDKFIKDFMRGDAKARTIEMDDVDMSDDGEGTDMEQTFSAAAGDPRIMQRIRLEGQVEKLIRQRDNYAQMITDTARKANSTKREIGNKTSAINKLQSLYDTWKSNRTEEPEVTINGKKYTGAKDITFELQNLAERYSNKMHDAVEIGDYRGIPLYAVNGELHIGKLGTIDSLEVWRMGTNSPNVVTARWNYQSLQAIMSNLPDRIAKQRTAIEKDQQFIDMAQRAANEPFPKKKQLEGKQNKLEAIKAEMAANPDVSPPWLRSGAPIGTSVYWKGEKYDVAGHRGDDKVLFADGDLFQTLPAAELTDAEGTPLFPDIYSPAATPDTVAEDPEVSDAQKAANEAQAAVDAQKGLNANQDQIIKRSLQNRSTSGMGIPISDELARAVITRVFGEIKLNVKRFDLLIKNLRVGLEESEIRELKSIIIEIWNTLREKKGLIGVATEAEFEAALANNVDTEVEQALEAVKALTESTPTAESQKSEPAIAGTASPPALPVDPATPAAESQTAPNPPMAGDEKTYSPKNEFTDSERERLGMGKRVPLGPHRRQIDIDLARAEINSVEGNARIDSTINDLMATGRAPSAYETALLNARYAQLDNKYEAALRAKVDAASKGDDVQASLHSNLAEKHLNEQMELLKLESTTASHALGAGLQARKDLINRDYTMPRSVLEFEAAFGRKPDKPGEMEAIQKMVDDINASNERLRKLLDEASEDIESLEARLKEAHDGKVRKPRESKPSDTKKPATEKKDSPRQKAAHEKINAAYKRIQAMLGGSTAFSAGGVIGEVGSVFVDLATGYSELGVITLGDFLSRVTKRMGPAAKNLIPDLTAGWKQMRASMTGQTDISQITDTIDPMDPDTIGRAARSLHSFVIERDGLDGSPDGREAAVAAVHAILVDFVPELTLDETARAMSGIGIYSELSDDQIEAIRRDQKAQLLLLEQISDWKKGQAPPATGQERGEISDEQRALRRAVNEAKKESGVETKTEGQLRSALDAAKRMVQNRIADLDKAIRENKPIKRSKTVLEDPSGELGRLQAIRDELQKQYDKAFGKNELSDEQRLNAAEKALDRAIANLEADLKEGKLYPDDPLPRLTSPAIEAKQATLDALKSSREELRLSSGEAEARSDAAYERKLKERNAELARRLAEGDFKPKPKKPERKLTPALLKEMRINENLKIEMLKKRKEWLFSQQHPVYRAFKKGVVGPAELWRKVMTAFDASLIGRQGRLLGGANPKIYAKAISKAFASSIWDAKSIFPSEQDLFNTQAELDADDKWVRLEKIGKLAITDVHGGVNREEGNQWSPEWADKMIPGLASSERSGLAFINTQRRLVFRSLVEKLARMHESDGGGMHTISASELRAIGNMINVASGRGDIGSWLNGVEGVSLLFFAPRWTASRIMWLVGEPLWHEARWRGGEGASPQVRKILAVEWGKQAAAQAVFTGFVLGTMYALIGPPGDDEEWDFYWDARSPYFGQLRYRNTYLDMTAGVSQFVSMMSRLITGTRDSRWKGVEEADRGRIAGRYIQGKLAPVPSVPADFIWGPMDPNVEAGSLEWLKGKVTPLMAQDTEGAMKEGEVVGSALTILAFLGNNSRTQEERVRERADAVNELRALQKQDKPERIQKVLNEHLKNAAKTEAKQKLRTADPDEVAGIQKVIDGVASEELTFAMKKEKFDIALRAADLLSTEDKRKKKKSSKEDKGISTSRELLKHFAPTYDEARVLFDEAYKRENGSLTERVGGERDGYRFVVKPTVLAARRRLKKIYEAD